MNIIDFLAIFPFIFSILLEGLKEFEVVGKTGKIIRLIRILRILRKNFVTTYYSVSIYFILDSTYRLFKLVRHFAGLQSLLITIQQAYQELGLLLFVVSVAILTYSRRLSAKY